MQIDHHSCIPFFRHVSLVYIRFSTHCISHFEAPLLWSAITREKKAFCLQFHPPLTSLSYDVGLPTPWGPQAGV